MMFPITLAENISAELLSFMDIDRFPGSPLKQFFTALFQGDSMWICGWNNPILGRMGTVLLNVQGPEYNICLKEKHNDPKADQATIMFAVGNTILFAKKGGSEIFNFHIQTHKFNRIFKDSKLTINAMCGSQDNVYILDKKQSDHIQILDSKFRVSGRMATGLGDVQKCSVDMCLISDINMVSKDHSHITREAIVVSTTNPVASVRLLDKDHGVLWQLDCRNPAGSKQLPLEFNPCSVSTYPNGCIFIADKGLNRVSINT